MEVLELSPQSLGDQDSLCPELEADAELSLCTWNVWSSKFERMARNVALLQCLSIHRPHVMVFQEVTPPFVRAVQACEWLKAEYWISATHHSQLGTLMVSRLKGESLKLITMPSRMGRRLLVLELPGGFRVATVHLEFGISPRDSNGTVRICSRLSEASAFLGTAGGFQFF